MHVVPPGKDLVQAMLPICLQKQMEGNQLVSKVTWTFVAHMAIGQTLQTVELVKQSMCTLGPVELEHTTGCESVPYRHVQ